jgi:hypothetical protein
MATTTFKMRAKGRAGSLDGRLLIIPIFLALALGVFTWTVKADSWTGAGENPASQIRDWNIPGNWSSNAPPLPNDQNFFTQLGDGTIELNGTQSAGAMIFGDFSYPTIDPGVWPIVSNLTMVNSPTGSSYFQMGESVRDTYGVNYFTAGPLFTTDVILSAPFNIDLGQLMGTSSAMMISGKILSNIQGNTITYTGYSTGSSLWITSVNDYSATGMTVKIVDGGAVGPSMNGHILHLANAGRLDYAKIELNSITCMLGLQDNTLAAAPNQYFNTVVCNYGGTIFTDRSYQLNDLDTTINGVQWLQNVIVQGVIPVVQFGTLLTYGRTNNGFSQWVETMRFEPSEILGAMVHNGNLTEDRGGSRYVSGANRLQEAHNYVNVQNLIVPNITPFSKGGAGVFWAQSVNGNGVWPNAPQVSAGVLRLGTAAIQHIAPAVNLLTADAGVGIAWNTSIDLRGFWGPITPFPVNPPGIVPGQSGAMDIDLWNFAGQIIDTNLWDATGANLTYLRVASSMGGDASFDTQPLAAKHASITPRTQIIPYIVQQEWVDIYYLGGGGGTLRIDCPLINYEERLALLEMGTTGTLLPGRVALNPGGDEDEEANTYSGPTEICAGTLQLMKRDSVFGTSAVYVSAYDLNITNGLYANPGTYHHPLWEGAGNYTWTGPGQLLLDPGRDPDTYPTDWSLYWYTAQGGWPLFNALQLDGGLIGWTGNVDLLGLPGKYAGTMLSDLTAPAGAIGIPVNVLGLGGEYSAGTMRALFKITDNLLAETPVLLYKAGKNSILDLRQCPLPNTYTGGTIIAGGEILVNDAAQLNAYEDNKNGGPICILNGGRLHIAGGGGDTNFWVPIMVKTNGTPDLTKNCGSVIEVDGKVTATLWANFDFSWNPDAYLEKDGSGTLAYNAPGPPILGMTPGTNAWGLKLTDGLVQVNQMPVDNLDSGPVIFNNGNLQVFPTPGMILVDTNPNYGFRNIVSFQGTGQGTGNKVVVEDNAMFRTYGSIPNEILGTISFLANGDDDPSNNVVHLSRNMASIAAPPASGDFSRGTGAMSFQGVTVYMSGGGQGNILNVLPQEAGFVLQLNDGVVFNADMPNSVWGEVQFNNNDTTQPVRIDGEEASPTPLTTSPYTFALTPNVWTILGTGLTTWSGTTEKFGPGTVAIKRSQGAPVSIINTNTLLWISGGTFEAGGSADPFTDTVSSFSLDIQNDSTATGLLISDGIKTVDQLTGVGNTTVSGPAGTELIVTYIAQNTLTVGAGCKVTIKPLPSGPLSGANLSAVPEPSTWIMLIIAALATLAGCRARRG